jgi:hypothetical protein
MHEVQFSTNDQWHICQDVRHVVFQESLVICCWQQEVQNSHVHKGGDGYLQMFSYLGIFVLDLSTLLRQLAITSHLTQNYCTLLLLRFVHFPRLCRTDTTTVSM